MITEKQATSQIGELSTLETLTRAYAEIASTRMKETRKEVLEDRVFLSAISDIFQEVRLSYANELIELVRTRRFKKGQRVTLLSHNGKTVAVFLSANTGLYGKVVEDTFDVFIKEVREKNSEVAIVGRLGLAMFQEAEPDRPYTYFDLPDHGVNPKELSQVIRHIVQYEEIHVYFGKFQSVISQIPAMFNITAEVPVASAQGGVKKPYIFEPSLEKILMFFESEIFASLFEQSVRESQLAKYASRIVAMDQASENIKGYIKKMQIERMKIHHGVSNRKQLNSLGALLTIRGL